MIETRHLSFDNRRGLRLAALLDRPQGDCLGAALFVHCFTCHKAYRLNRLIARELAAVGIAVLRIDLSGLGESEGVFAETDFGTAVDDIVDASAFLREQVPVPQCLLGHSLGGTMALAAAASIDGCRAVVTINAPPDPAHVAAQFADHEDKIARDGSARVRIGDAVHEITSRLLDDLRGRDMAAIVEALGRRPVFVVHAEDDRLVPLALGERLFDRLAQPKAFAAVTGSDHLLSGRDDAADVGRLIAAWVRRPLAGGR